MASSEVYAPRAPEHTLEELQKFLQLNRQTGVLTWKVTRGKAVAGAAAGCVLPKGRILIRVEGRAYFAHHLVWFFLKKAWPTEGLDHFSGNPGDNRPSNLREASQSLNMQNLKGPRADNSSGFLGVSLYKPNGKYRATIYVAGRHKSLGYYEKPEQASRAYLTAKRQLHPGCTL